MTIHVDAYTSGGVASGLLARPGHLRETLEHEPTLDLERATWRDLSVATPRPAGELSMPIDDVLVAVADEDLTVAVHASWHAIRLEVGPYIIEGELPTLPGFDPGRALTRPSGEFVVLRDVRLSMLADPTFGTALGHHALVNRYGVERVTADIMLGFFFPGAVMDGLEVASA